jgi:hypothetical protein
MPRRNRPPIIEAVWQALTLRLHLAPPGAWHDADRLADDTAGFLDCSPALVDELLHAAVDAGQLETRHHHDRHQIRARRTRDRAPRERKHR